MKSLSKAASLPSFPLLGRRERGASTLHRPHSPFKEVAVDGREPLQHHGVGRVAHDLGGKGDRRRLPGGLPALVHQVQVTVHSGDLIGREGVSAVVICKRAEGEIRTSLQRAGRQENDDVSRWTGSQHPSPCQLRAGLFQCSGVNGL